MHSPRQATDGLEKLAKLNTAELYTGLFCSNISRLASKANRCVFLKMDMISAAMDDFI